MSKKVITFGEIMLRLATPDYLRFCQANQFNATFGGGEANVAASLANYGIETEFVTRLPQNDIARACVMELRKQGIGTSKIIYGGERLGIYFLETGAVARASKVVYDRAHSSIAEIRPGMIDWDEYSRMPLGFTGQVSRQPYPKVPPTYAWKRYRRQTDWASRYPATSTTGKISGNTVRQPMRSCRN